MVSAFNLTEASDEPAVSQALRAELNELVAPLPSATLGTGAPGALSVHGLLERRCDAFRRFLQGIVGEMGVTRGGLGLGVAEDSPNHRQALAPITASEENVCQRSWMRTSSSPAALRIRRHGFCRSVRCAPSAVQRAVARGVRAHHWRFGDMPRVEGLTRGDVAAIVAYVRELQRANGIR